MLSAESTCVTVPAPDLAEAHYLMGQIYEQEKDGQQAAGEYRAAGRFRPQ
jgi:hypothetical protein